MSELSLCLSFHVFFNPFLFPSIFLSLSHSSMVFPPSVSFLLISFLIFLCLSLSFSSCLQLGTSAFRERDQKQRSGGQRRPPRPGARPRGGTRTARSRRSRRSHRTRSRQSRGAQRAQRALQELAIFSAISGGFSHLRKIRKHKALPLKPRVIPDSTQGWPVGSVGSVGSTSFDFDFVTQAAAWANVPIRASELSHCQLSKAPWSKATPTAQLGKCLGQLEQDSKMMQNVRFHLTVFQNGLKICSFFA